MTSWSTNRMGGDFGRTPPFKPCEMRSVRGALGRTPAHHAHSYENAVSHTKRGFLIRKRGSACVRASRDSHTNHFHRTVGRTILPRTRRVLSILIYVYQIPSNSLFFFCFCHFVIGIPEYVGPGNLHDPAYTNFAKEEVLNDDIDFPTGSKSSAVYTLTVYPTSKMFNEFTTDAPLHVALGFMGAIAFCTLVFFMYDNLMRYDAHQRKAVFDMKRKFVRFISHEIRTPLNTVCMGLELLESEFQTAAEEKKKTNNQSSRGGSGKIGGIGASKEIIKDEDGSDSEDDIDFWLNVATDVKDNAHGTLRFEGG